ncbi:hypothetical protein Daci_1930 [Delftia acidovorans SPH-1]|uniref:Uncharacterized protein n=1 Tax=Delftia acidovorans (strain DSM 14801 / SPH-1) TaxID=398578 RepID=A9BYM7_DELAS|nr:hypothetical protein [Delftia acidovorans]ABX34570.1 hypothetical protein Daci_1930 [Delftia acidovorans SPH-1]QPS76061.1 hypothetical protein I6G48_05765 [Delftia acidovorans]
MYADPKRIRSNRVPVYLDDYIYERLTRLVEIQGGEKSVVSRDAFERGLELLEKELHAQECAQGAGNKRDVGSCLA